MKSFFAPAILLAVRLSWRGDLIGTGITDRHSGNWMITGGDLVERQVQYEVE